MKKKPSSYKDNARALKAHAERYISSMNWALSPEHYAYMIATVNASNIANAGFTENLIDMVPERPDAWLKDIQARAEEPKSDIILPPEKKIILP